MRKIYVFALVSLLLFAGCSAAPLTPAAILSSEPQVDPLVAQVAQYQTDVSMLVSKWNGHTELAVSTASIALSPVIAMLQEDQQEIMALAGLEPLTTYRDEMNDGMKYMILGFMNLRAEDAPAKTWLVLGQSHFEAG
jgi:PBP1b-binding outer membrane lipoprotein LpoB